jgi:hypothetical protein
MLSLPMDTSCSEEDSDDSDTGMATGGDRRRVDAGIASGSVRDGGLLATERAGGLSSSRRARLEFPRCCKGFREGFRKTAVLSGRTGSTDGEEADRLRSPVLSEAVRLVSLDDAELFLGMDRSDSSVGIPGFLTDEPDEALLGLLLLLRPEPKN